MGFRSTYITEDYAIEWPEWYRNRRAISSGGIPYSIAEQKYPGEFIADTWKALKEVEWFEKDYDIEFNVVLLHECGGVTKVQMGKEYLIVADPTDWEVVEKQTEQNEWVKAQGRHCYCYGCSDLRDYVKTEMGNGK